MSSSDHLHITYFINFISTIMCISSLADWGVVADIVPNGMALTIARELASLYLKAPEVTRRTRIHFIQPLKEIIVREVGYGLSLEGAVMFMFI